MKDEPKEEIKEEKVEKAEFKKAKPAPKPINPLTVITFILALSACGLGVYNYYNGGSVTNYNYSNDGNSLNFEAGSIAEVVNKISDSVVSITTEVRTQSFWGTESTGQAAGTGFILSEDGYIMTNKHVVEDARTVSVTLSNGKTYSNVKVVGLDPLNDSAILKVDNPENFKPVTLGDSKTINVGQQVIVIGNALGEYSNSVTSGIVSGTGRELIASDSSGSAYERLTDMIQTDAAINGGNSGGPLVNAAGEVIGIATAYASSSQTIGFVIPIANVKGIIKNVLETGEFARAVLGVSYTEVTADIAEKNNLPVNYGAYVNSDSGSAVISGGAAEAAGIKNGDIITEVNGVKIGKAGSLSTLVGEYKVGDEITIKFYRDGKEQTAKVTLKAYKA
ncbi:trypsin-like peptidase domain-containing protein [Candidatus Saccharibacteria bacterium]|nr:trypsin-like peptidase domain-containing protein [Candidatus Saccharibacteria bacterium]